MIPKIAKRGARTVGLLAYLYGPGIRDAHTDPHLVASWDGTAPDPGRDPGVPLKALARLLDDPVRAVPERRRPARHVWHCSVRAAPDDRLLSDEEWAGVARRIVAATGIATGADDGACRWAAVRHAEDHVHIVATLVREDGRRPRLQADAARAQAECRRIEEEWDLRRLHPGDGTAAQRPTSAERFKAERHHRTRTPREQLREAVRQAVAGANDPQEFFTRLTAQGVLIHRRHAPSGDLLGYTVALPGDRNHAGEPVWFSGAKLAPDLSWPRIHQRLTAQTPGTAQGNDASASPGRAARARHAGADAAWNATGLLTEEGEEVAAGQIAAAGEVLDALAATTTGPTRTQITAAARAFERASRSHTRAAHAQARALRRAARDIINSGPALGRGQDGAATAMALSALILLAVAAHRWHAARAHQQQAAAVLQAAQHLRAAYGIAATRPLATWHAQGIQLPAHRLAVHAAALRAAYPEGAEQVLTEPGWPALAATLDHAERTGADPLRLLVQAVAQRELTTAQSVSDVLLWRLRRLAGLPQAGERHDGDAAGRNRSAAVLPPRAGEGPLAR
ncbi:relaxase/mobilization nuclease domain-containing protein [Streptomyces sp. SBT349]|uniref:relaxase/mobilization nuclease domain-containing protein n=1 Tax=Streptomyces sp. SBT349 TaxID=1580539 RepID=UPI00066E9707|nr:mobilization protein [Streptomyces sp. SBT349]